MLAPANYYFLHQVPSFCLFTPVKKWRHAPLRCACFFLKSLQLYSVFSVEKLRHGGYFTSDTTIFQQV